MEPPLTDMIKGNTSLRMSHDDVHKHSHNRQIYWHYFEENRIYEY